MTETLLSILWLLAAAWLMVRAFRQSRILKSLRPGRPHGPADVAIIVPARNEEANIERCIKALGDQIYSAGRLDIVVVDDQSTDATPLLVARLARCMSGLRLKFAPPLPPGWVGKCHACWWGAASLDSDPEWLCFMDADVWAEPGLIEAAIREVQASGLDLLSLAPRQELGSFAERLLMPCGFYLLSFRQDLRRALASDSQEVAATGQFLLVRRAKYGAAGGHAAVKDQICEDVALTRLIKTSGGRVTLMSGDGMLSTRMYDGWASLWEGLTKNIVEMLGGPAATVCTALAAVLLSWTAVALPIAAAASCAASGGSACAAAALAATASAAIFAFHVGGALFFGIPVWYGLIFPLGYTVGAFMAVDSVRRRVARRTAWKGRVYP